MIMDLSGRDIGGKKLSKGAKASEKEIGGGVHTDGDPTARGCVDSAEICKGRRWGVLPTEWNGATRARVRNAQDRGGRCVQMTSGQV